MKTNKIFALLLCLALMLPLVPAFSLTASAEENSTEYTLTVPATLPVKNAGWNATDGITAQVSDGNTFDSGKCIVVTAASANDWALKSGDYAIDYTLTTAADGKETTVWEFTAEELDAGTTKAMGIVVEDYSDAPVGVYTDTVTFTASVEKAFRRMTLTAEEGVDTVFDFGDIVVTVPADVARTSDTLTLTLMELTEAEAQADGGYTIGYSTNDNRYFLFDLDGLDAENTSATMTVTIPIGTGLNMSNVRHEKKLHTKYTAQNGVLSITNLSSLGKFTVSYQIRITLANTDTITLTDTIADGTATAVLNGASYTTIKVPAEELVLDVTETTPHQNVSYMPEKQVAFAYDVSIKGLTSGNAALTIPVGDKIAANAMNLSVYRNGNTLVQNVTYDAESRTLNIPSVNLAPTSYTAEPSNNITVVYTLPTELELKLAETLRALDTLGGGTVVIDTANETALPDLANFADAISGKSNVILKGKEDGTPRMLSTAAVITNANGFSMQNFDAIYSTGCSITGNGLLLDNVRIEKSDALNYYTVKLVGAGTTVRNSTFTSYGSRYAQSRQSGALRFGNDTADSVTTVDNCRIIAFDPQNPTADQHEVYKTAGWNAPGSIGIVYDGFAGTLNITNTTIDVLSDAIQLGIDAEPTTGTLNVSGSTINSTSMGFERVRSINFTETTFRNDWTDDALTINNGQYSQNYVYKDCSFQTALCYSFSTSTAAYPITITLDGCTFGSGNTAMTEDNYEALVNEYFSFICSSSTAYEGQLTGVTRNAETGVVTVTATNVKK